MIYKRLSIQEVQELSEELQKRLPGTAKVFYVIRCFLDGLLPGKEVIVDAWPEWSSLIVRTCSESETQPFFRDTYMCHATSPTALKYFLQRPDVVNWRKPATFTGVPHDVAPVIATMCKKHKGQLSSMEPRFMYAWRKTELPPPLEVPAGLRLCTLVSEDAVTLRRDWEGRRYREDLEGYFRTVIEQFDSSCLRDENGELVAYACMQFNGSMAMLYVKPDHQNRDYWRIVLVDLARRRLEKGEVAYGFIPTNDSNLVEQMRALDFVWVPSGDMVWMHYEPLKISVPATSMTLKGAQANVVRVNPGDELTSLDCVPFSMSKQYGVFEECRNEVNQFNGGSSPVSNNGVHLIQDGHNIVTLS